MKWRNDPQTLLDNLSDCFVVVSSTSTVTGWISGLYCKVQPAWLCGVLSSSIPFPRDIIPKYFTNLVFLVPDWKLQLAAFVFSCFTHQWPPTTVLLSTDPLTKVVRGVVNIPKCWSVNVQWNTNWFIKEKDRINCYNNLTIMWLIDKDWIMSRGIMESDFNFVMRSTIIISCLLYTSPSPRDA